MRSHMRRTAVAPWASASGHRIAAVLVPARCVVVRSRRSGCRGVMCAAASFAAGNPSQAAPELEEGPRAFPYPLPMTPSQSALSSVPLPVFYPGLAAGIGALAYSVSILAKSLPVDPALRGVVSIAAAAVTAAAAAFYAAQAKKVRDSVAVVDLYNHLVQLAEPSMLTAEDVQAIGAKYGITMQKDEPEGLRKVYSQMLETIIPSGENQLRGDEADKVRSFKDALGLTDEEAAPIHLEVGRRFFRLSYETKDRQAQFEQRKAFQKLMYVSQVVFGDQKAAFLLPWRRTFNLTDAQLFVARRDNAIVIFKGYLDSNGGDIQANRTFLHELRKKQVSVKLLDEWAVDVVKEYSRRHVEGYLTKALDLVRATGKNKNIPGAVEALRHVLDYNRKLVAYSSEDDLIPGLGQITLAGGPWAGDARARDVKELYKMFLDEELARVGDFSGDLERDSRELLSLLSLRPREAQALQDEVAAKLYRNLLREAVVSKRLEASPSPATILQELCQKARFSPEGAQEFHKIQYRVKVLALVEKGRLTDADVEDLKKIRRMLCISNDVVNKVMRDTAGKALEDVLTDIFMMGPKPVLDLEMQRVDVIMNDMRLDSEVAVDVLASAARERLNAYVQQAQKAGDRAGVAAPLKKMIQFNALVVTPLLERVKGMDAARSLSQQAAAAGGEAAPSIASTSAPAEDEVAEARRKMQARRGDFAEEEARGQTEISLRDLVVPEMRAELYKNYLMQTMSGEKVQLPVGGTIRKKGNEATRSAEMTRVQSLADILGMSKTEVAQVHQGLGEQAYKQSASEALKAGPLGEQTLQYLEDMRVQLGLSKEVSVRVLKQARTEVFGTNAPSEEGGRWTVERLQAMAKDGTPADAVMEEPQRRNLFRREVDARLTDGSGDLDAEFVLKTLPKLLVLDERKVRMTLKELAASRKRRELVQAVSQLRQKRLADVVTALQNLLSCSKVLPAEGPMEWPNREEVKNVYTLYCGKELSEAKQEMLQKILGLTEEEVQDARATAASTSGAQAEAAEEAFL